jgi:hypothetical protein
MNIELDLPNPLDQELSLEATRLNVSLSDYILKVLMLRRDWLEKVEDAEDLADAKIALMEEGLARCYTKLGLSLLLCEKFGSWMRLHARLLFQLSCLRIIHVLMVAGS